MRSNIVLFFNKIFKPKYLVFWVVVLYLAIFIFVFRSYLFSEGIPVGIDWSFPVFPYQVKNWFLSSCYTWMQNLNAKEIFGAKMSFATGYYVQLASYTFTAIAHVQPAVLQRIIIFASFLFGGLNTYFYLRRINTKPAFAFLGGLVFTLNPVTFNFFLMGWCFSLLSLFTFPLVLLLIHKYDESDNYSYLIWLSLLMGTISFLESQSIVNFFILITVYFFLISKNTKIQNLLKALRNVGLIALISFGLHLFWIIPNIFVKDPYLSSSVVMGDAWRFAMHFSAVNYLRGWGSVVNYFFEYSYPARLIIFSYLPSLSLIFCLIFLIKRRLVRLDLFFLVLFFYPLLMYWFSRDLATHIPYSNVIRDFGRTYPFFFFAVAFSLKWIRSQKTTVVALVSVLFLLMVWPYFDGSLYGVSGPVDQGVSMHKIDQRLRLLNYGSDFEKIDQFLSKQNFNEKAWLLPSAGGFLFDNDSRFQGEWANIWDMAPSLSSHVVHPLQTFDAKGKMKVIFDEYKNGFTGDQCSSDVKPFLQDMTNHRIFYLLLRSDVSSVYGLSSDKIENCLNESNLVSQVFDYEEYKLFKIKIEDFLPAIYSPDKISFSTVPKNNSGDQELLTTLLTGQFQIEAKNRGGSVGSIEYKRVDSTKYKIIINDAKGIVPIVFFENFHPEWKVYQSGLSPEINLKTANTSLPSSSEWSASQGEISEYITNGEISTLGSKNQIDFISKMYHNSIQNENISSGNIYDTWLKQPVSAEHYIANGYENGWRVDIDKLCDKNNLCRVNLNGSNDVEIIIEFWPQRLLHLGIFLSSLTLFLSFVFIYKFNRKYA